MKLIETIFQIVKSQNIYDHRQTLRRARQLQYLYTAILNKLQIVYTCILIYFKLAKVKIFQ